MSTPETFVVKNITAPPGRIIKVFNVQVYPGMTIDIMKITGVTEDMVRSSLLSGDLKNKIENGQLQVITHPILVASQASNRLLDIIGTSNNVRPIPIVPGRVKNLISGTPLSLFQIDLSQTFDYPDTAPDYSFGGKLFFAVECTDGYEVQVREGDVNIAAVMRGNGVISTAQAANQTGALTTGTLTTTFAWVTSGTIATLQLTATTSISSPTDFKAHYFLLHATHRGAYFSL